MVPWPTFIDLTPAYSILSLYIPQSTHPLFFSLIPTSQISHLDPTVWPLHPAWELEVYVHNPCGCQVNWFVLKHNVQSTDVPVQVTSCLCSLYRAVTVVAIMFSLSVYWMSKCLLVACEYGPHIKLARGSIFYYKISTLIEFGPP